MEYINPQVAMYLEKIYNAQTKKGSLSVSDLVRSLIKREDSVIMGLIWKYGEVKTGLESLLFSVEQCIKEANLFKIEEFRIDELIFISKYVIAPKEIKTIMLKYYSEGLTDEDIEFVRKFSLIEFKLDENRRFLASYGMINVLLNLILSEGKEFTIQDIEEFIIAQWYTDIEKLFRMYSIDCYNEEVQKIMTKYPNSFNFRLIKDKNVLKENDEKENPNDKPDVQPKEKENSSPKIVLDKDMQSYCTILNDDFSADKIGEILGRDQEVEELFDVLLKRTKRNAILVGDAGVGKTAIVEELTRRIVIGDCPEELKDCKVVQIDVTSIIAGTKYRGEAEKRFKKVQQLLTKYPKIIAFIDEIHMVLGAGSCEGDTTDMSNALKPILAKNEARIIGATTSVEYYKYFSNDPAFKRRFEKIEVKEPYLQNVYSMIKNKVKALEEYHGVHISKKMVEQCIYAASCFNINNKNPDRTIDLLDKVMGKAKKFNLKSVNKKCLERVYANNYKKFNEMTYEDKKTIAYHEAGHFILNTLTSRGGDKVIAVTIIPADDYLGANILEACETEAVVDTRKDCINRIAEYLGGRVAERIYTNELSSGATSDLEKATYTAYRMVTKLGMGTNVGVNRVYKDSEQDKMYNHDIINKIDEEVNNIISESYKIAEKILQENKASLEEIVEKLLENGIVSGDELKNILLKNRGSSEETE